MASMGDRIQNRDPAAAYRILGGAIARHEYFLQNVDEGAADIKGTPH